MLSVGCDDDLITCLLYTSKNGVVILKFVKKTKYFFRLTVRRYKACKNAVKANAELFPLACEKIHFIGKIIAVKALKDCLI